MSQSERRLLLYEHFDSNSLRDYIGQNRTSAVVIYSSTGVTIREPELKECVTANHAPSGSETHKLDKETNQPRAESV